jgi:hypothetical protein
VPRRQRNTLAPGVAAIDLGRVNEQIHPARRWPGLYRCN